MNIIKNFQLPIIYFIILTVNAFSQAKDLTTTRIYKYDTDNVAVYTGTISSVNEEHWYSSEDVNLTAVLKASDGQLYVLDLGMKSLYKDDLPSLDQTISVKGSMVIDNNEKIILAEKVHLESGSDVKVRSGKGIPEWQKSSFKSIRQKSFRYNMKRMRRKH